MTIRAVVLVLVLAGVSLAQEPPRESTQPAFRAQTDLVVVPFQVRRGSRPVSDLEPSDVVLLEDGVPRAIAGFEAPSARRWSLW